MGKVWGIRKYSLKNTPTCNLIYSIFYILKTFIRLSEAFLLKNVNSLSYDYICNYVRKKYLLPDNLLARQEQISKQKNRWYIDHWEVQFYLVCVKKSIKLYFCPLIIAYHNIWPMSITKKKKQIQMYFNLLNKSIWYHNLLFSINIWRWRCKVILFETWFLKSH